jgi:hypothetical protein
MLNFVSTSLLDVFLDVVVMECNPRNVRMGQDACGNDKHIPIICGSKPFVPLVVVAKYPSH